MSTQQPGEAPRPDVHPGRQDEEQEGEGSRIHRELVEDQHSAEQRDIAQPDDPEDGRRPQE